MKGMVVIMGFFDVVKTTGVVLALAKAVISGMNLPHHIEQQYGEWAKEQASSWVSAALTEGQISERLKSKANSLKR
jgi:hypothetical protein